ncbi:hypothetical protein [Celeribacter indicus]|uniref:Uncharacterized protein n=1 Tax=Celeribacter indicus TaxID=1208324 RepID=A0A0B5E0M9_9RHOB|nr:hypothetical protein [Celeribacter indicus]AJE46022.1 hypothetical protein P73_1307 [Celeribacter indicus]SDX33040.1 hypothetical protein SAMN05443573_12223 [Celeribacter indicus]
MPERIGVDMVNTVEKWRENLRELQAQIELEALEARERFQYRFRNGRVVFEEEARRRGREWRVRWSVFLARARPWEIISAPVIYALIVPFVLLDLCVTLYQAICFPIYGIPKVERRAYIAVDRHKLTYLNAMQKLNCVYCGYCNGLLAYVREIAGRTEYYWCPIRHARPLPDRHAHYNDFLPFGDGVRFDERFIEMKKHARACEGCDGCSH